MQHNDQHINRRTAPNRDMNLERENFNYHCVHWAGVGLLKRLRTVWFRAAGLPGEHVLTAGVAGSSTGVQCSRQQDGGRATRRHQLGHHLDPGHVPAQREGCQLSRNHRRKSHVEAGLRGRAVVRHKVSNQRYRERRADGVFLCLKSLCCHYRQLFLQRFDAVGWVTGRAWKILAPVIFKKCSSEELWRPGLTWSNLRKEIRWLIKSRK